MVDDRSIPRGVASLPTEQEEVVVHFDGACQPPRGGGIASYGYTIDGADGHVEGMGLAVRPGVPHATNNVAEYSAAICALERLLADGYRGRVVLRGDSQLIIRQMSGEYGVKSEHLRAYHERLAQLVREFPIVRFEWVPREENRRADELSKLAIEAERSTLRRERDTRPSGPGH